MFESGYYPMGAENDPRAPWNQSDPEEATRDIDYSCVMHRVQPVSTTEYTPGEYEKDEDGFVFREEDDFSDTDWLTEFADQYRNPAQLIAILREIATELAAGRIPQKRRSQWQHIAEDCQNWEIDDEYAEEYEHQSR